MKEEEKRLTIRRELIDELLKECTDPKDLLAEGGLLKQLTSALIERCLETEMEEHLGYPKHAKRSDTTRNARERSCLSGVVLPWWWLRCVACRWRAFCQVGRLAEPNLSNA